MRTSKNNLFAILVASISLLVSSAAMAKAPTGRPGQTGNTTGKGSSTTTTLAGKNRELAEEKEQHLEAEKELREANLERAREKEQMLKDKNSSNGITITHGGGNLPKEPGNNPNKDCNHDCGHDYCGKNYCRDHYRSCYMECSYASVGPMNTYVVRPGDTLETISLKFFGNPSDSTTIATFNHLPINAVLTPGQTLMLPPFSTAL